YHFPYTTLFRSGGDARGGHARRIIDDAAAPGSACRRYASSSRCQGARRVRREALRRERRTERECRRRYQSGEVSARTSGLGARRENSPAVRYFTEGIDSTAPLAVSFSACSTTYGALSQVMRGS